MLAIVGILIVLAMVFGGYLISGGSMAVLAHALPLEMMIIGGSGLGATVISHGMGELKALKGGFVSVFKGPRHSRQNYLDTIFLVAKLMKMLKVDGPVALESHVEDPASSSVFQEYPQLMADKTLIHLICDTLRLVVVSSGTLDPMAVDDVMDQSIKTHHHEALQPATSLQNLADALPALGIVAAVLGVIKTMGAIDQPAAVLGGMIGSALVGTFLGVMLAYGFIGPFANRARGVAETDGLIYGVVKQIIVASLNGHPLPLVIEAARAGIPHDCQPGFAEVFDGMRKA